MIYCITDTAGTFANQQLRAARLRSADTEGLPTAAMVEYEAERQARIAENKRRMTEIGLAQVGASASLRSCTFCPHSPLISSDTPPKHKVLPGEPVISTAIQKTGHRCMIWHASIAICVDEDTVSGSRVE